MNILITGGCGFIGLRLAEQLLDEGHTVYLFDLHSRPSQRTLTEARFIQGNITYPPHLINALGENNIDWLVHLAARLSVPSEEDPWASFEVNVNGTYRALEASRICGVDRFVFASSVATYGLHLPTVIDDETIQRPVLMYGVTKVFGEQLGSFYRRRFGLDFRSIRLPQVIGPGVRTPGIAQCFPLAIEHAARGEPYEMWVPEDARVPLVYYKDAAAALNALLHAPEEDILTVNYNLAGISPMFNASTMVEALRKQIPTASITFSPDPELIEVFRNVRDTKEYDDSRLREETGYKPAYDLDDALEDFVKEISASGEQH